MVQPQFYEGMMLTLPGCIWSILLLLHTADCVTHKVITPVHQITAVAGESVVLPCYVDPSISAEGWTVEWFNLNLSERSIYLYEDGKENCEAQNPSFRTRTALFKEELKTGNTSLKLVGVRATDEGTYKCFVRSPTSKWYDDSNITVSVKAVGSQPVVSIEGHRGAGMGLVCETRGWYPEPEVVWLDSKGDSLSADPPEMTRDSVGRYTLKLRVTVQKAHRNLFNCRVKQKYIKRDETARIHVPDALFYEDHTWKWILAAVIAVVSVLASAVVISILVMRHRNKKTLIEEKGLLTYHQETLSRQLDLVNTRGYQDYEAVRHHAVDVTLDPDTAHPRLILSADGKQVSCGVEQQNLPETPKRYDTRLDVLGTQGFSSGRFYYEVQVNKTEWHLGVAKESCKRKGDFYLRPRHGYWTITLREGGKYLALTDIHVHLHLSQKPQKVGVFVDYEEGTVSFYNVETKGHIFSFTDCAFTEKLHPFFSPAPPCVSGENDPLVICPVDNVKPDSAHLSESQAVESDSAHLSESQAVESDSAHLSESQAVESDSAHLSESQAVESDSAHLSPLTYESDSAHQLLLDQGQQSESSEEINESVCLLEQSVSYKV
ncbi:butyrophilin subfamily 3 member A1-like isoform X2 [Osmerus eperlanus]|uniref:butyrophilin subfamily 3 member A1-like isoform X2 n=1 Tax=Osmerus eperlanus TaxID=29151 RepID=UPI002E0F7472